MLRIREGLPVAACIALVGMLPACQADRLLAPTVDESDVSSLDAVLVNGRYNPRLVALALTEATFMPPAFRDHRDDIATSAELESLVTNGSFESNGGIPSATFTGWTVVDAGSGHWYVQSGTAHPKGDPYLVPAPTDGTFAAMTNQTAPGSHILYQDVTVPAGGANLSFDLFIGNRATAFHIPNTLAHTGQGANQQFRMDIVDPAQPIMDVANVLQMVYRTEPGDQLVRSDYFTVTASLDAFAGQTIRLRFAEVDNQLNFQAGIDNVIVTATQSVVTVVAVDVDIKPGGDINPVNLKSRGRLPVAILTTGDFDAAVVDPATVTLGDDDGNDTGVAARPNGSWAAGLEDVDGDGDLDLMLHFDTRALVGNGDLHAGTTVLVVNGETWDGTPIHGSDTVRLIP